MLLAINIFISEQLKAELKHLHEPVRDHLKAILSAKLKYLPEWYTSHNLRYRGQFGYRKLFYAI